MKKLLSLLLILILSTCNVYAANQWRKGTGEDVILGTENISDIDTVSFQNIVDPLDRLLSNYRDGVEVAYASSSTITVSAGEIICSNAAGTVRLMVKNTSATTVDWTDLDTGAEQASTTYYLYAIVTNTTDATFTVKISASSTTPSGVTYYKRIGSFYNDSSSNISRTQVYNQPYRPSATDSSGAGIITAIYDYNTSASSFTSYVSSLKVCYGTITIASGASQAITNLPFSSSSSYVVALTEGETTSVANELLKYLRNSGSQATIYNDSSFSLDIGWIMIGQ